MGETLQATPFWGNRTPCKASTKKPSLIWRKRSGRTASIPTTYDWLGRAYGRLAEGSSFLSALGYAKKTVRTFERAVELGLSNLEALSDVFEYYLQAPEMVGGWLDKAYSIARC